MHLKGVVCGGWGVCVEGGGPVPPASVLRTLRHPHIIELIECAERGGVMYMVLELLTGGKRPSLPFFQRRKERKGWVGERKSGSGKV